MDWLRKKTKEVQNKVAKIQQDQKLKSQTFSGTGNVLNASAAPPQPPASKPSPFKRPVASNLSEEERALRRQQQAEAAAKRGVPQPKKRTTAASDISGGAADDDDDEEASEIFEQAKALERMRIEESGFNPYQATFSSSTEARSASVQAAEGNTAPPPPQSTSRRPSPPPATLLDVPAATATTLRKLLENILANPEEEKYQKLRLSNAAIHTKIAAVPEAVVFLHEIGFDLVEMEDSGEEFLVLNATRTSTDTLQQALAKLP
ncbi:Aste57867_15945 [Aphanomyces stellatus]|uniref:Aste57867_15945 protein n=1 Tax=Aphanomyces stellatus TaxID=120398 RepID=A0A485L7F8_9STRA|nr:hypothetical protein As57867_015889 [Aphanomyces stellatus]VFT92731.1 Aste57867_15945 [Aphanomyces stellatus]